MKLRNVCRTAIVSLAVSVLLGVAAQAAPITMQTSGGGSTAVLDAVVGSFSVSLGSGDTATNELAFVIDGNTPAVGVAAMVFDGATILDSDLFDPDHMITGFVLPNSGAVAGVLIDFTGKDAATLTLKLSSTPTTATIYSLNLLGTSTLYRSDNWRRFAIEKDILTFSSNGGAPIPEPGAALCFGAGLILVGSRLRRR
jgi:hypothetical protein